MRRGKSKMKRSKIKVTRRKSKVRRKEVAALSHHDLNGFSSYPVYLSIRNLGNFSFMGEKSKLDILINNYSIKYPLQFEPSDGQDLTGFLS